MTQAIGLGVKKEFARVGVIEADLEGISSLYHCVCLDPQQALMEKTAAHDRQHSAVGNDLTAGHVVGLAVAVLALHRLNGLEHGGHGHALGHIFVFQEKCHR